MDCMQLCPPVVTETIPTNNYVYPGSGGGGAAALFTQDSDMVTFSGNGTEADPLSATLISGQPVEFEASITKIGGMADGDTLALYVPTKATTFPAGLVGSEFNVEDQAGDILVNLLRNDIVVGQIEIVGGVPDVTLAADIVLNGSGDKLEVIAASVSTFSSLSLTLLGLRTLDYAE
jgi:hypothetical protein